MFVAFCFKASTEGHSRLDKFWKNKFLKAPLYLPESTFVGSNVLFYLKKIFVDQIALILNIIETLCFNEKFSLLIYNIHSQIQKVIL